MNIMNYEVETRCRFELIRAMIDKIEQQLKINAVVKPPEYSLWFITPIRDILFEALMDLDALEGERRISEADEIIRAAIKRSDE